MLTTTIGSYPKPDFMSLPGFIAKHPNPTARYSEWLATRGEADIEAAREGARAIVREQAGCGIDIPTDGEAPREHYVYYHLRHIEGFDFESLAERSSRGGAWSPKVPVLRGPVAPGVPFLAQDWRNVRDATDRGERTDRLHRPDWMTQGNAENQPCLQRCQRASNCTPSATSGPSIASARLLATAAAASCDSIARQSSEHDEEGV